MLIPVQIVAGDLHGLNTLEHQPQKVAAIEANWQTRSRAPLLLFAGPTRRRARIRSSSASPGGASLVLTHDLDGAVPGLNDFVADDGKPLHPPVAPVFWSFRVMVGTGVLMLTVAWFGAWTLWRRRATGDFPRWLLRAFVAMTLSGWVATLAGWYTTEVGRQPWVVQGVLTTAEAIADLPAVMVASTLAVYLTLYAALTIAYVSVLFYAARKAAQGGDAAVAVAPPPQPRLRLKPAATG